MAFDKIMLMKKAKKKGACAAGKQGQAHRQKKHHRKHKKCAK
ncbi:hypothetical protein ACH4UM_04890 [Streptomyces sp. NPDC020801]